MLIHWLWYANIPLQPLQRIQLLQYFSDPEEIYCSREEDLHRVEGITQQMMEALTDRDLAKAEAILDCCRELGIGILHYHDRSYPSRLRYISTPPMVLYYKGTLPDWEASPVIGIVGTRKASSYGLQTARRLSGQIAACGGLVVSGAAYGVDTMAMQGALAAGKPVVGILGCGVDVVYPKSNRELFSRTVENGCLLSEYPPNTPPLPWHFPERNRIISGISNGVLVVEAPEKSGALITAAEARDQGRDVFAVPGNIDVASCAGSNGLLQQGAIAALSGWDVIKEYEMLYPGIVKKQEISCTEPEPMLPKVAQNPVIPGKAEKENGYSKKKSIDNGEKSTYSVLDKNLNLSEEEQAVASVLTPRAQPVDEIIAQAAMPAGKVLSILTRLTLKGVAKNHPNRHISLK